MVENNGQSPTFGYLGFVKLYSAYDLLMRLDMGLETVHVIDIFLSGLQTVKGIVYQPMTLDGGCSNRLLITCTFVALLNWNVISVD